MQNLNILIQILNIIYLLLLCINVICNLIYKLHLFKRK